MVPEAPLTPPTYQINIEHQIAAEEEQYLQAVEAELNSFFTRQQELLGGISSEALPLLEAIKELYRGGKRMRALLAYWGWRGAGGQKLAPEIVRAGCAIELFQSAALIHDDIIDNSDTRRGAPATHKRFESVHSNNNWRTSSSHYGMSAAIIVGDLCLSWSEEMFSSIGSLAISGSEARYLFDLMRTEVMAGQFLDVLGEVITQDCHEAALARAEHVIQFKSAKYSCEHPLALGGALALNLSHRETSSLITSYREFALPLGEGFQLRDDVLGVFGKPQETGKPAGDDLKEGKRTVLIALAQKNLTNAHWQVLDASLGSQELTGKDIENLQAMIVDSGALSELEQIIASKESIADAKLQEIKTDPLVHLALAKIAAKALHRKK